MSSVHVQIANKPVDFSVARPGTNVVLVAEGKEIHVNKEFLSAHSPYFNTLLLSPNFVESSYARVEIDYNYGDLLMCIEIVHGKGPLPCGKMDITILQDLIEAADRFDLPVVRRFCEGEIVSNRADVVMMFHFCCHYNLEDAKNIVLGRMTAKDLRSFFIKQEKRFDSPSNYNLNLSAKDLERLVKMLL